MGTEGNLEYIDSRKQQHEIIEELFVKQAEQCKPLRILEAGCGRSWPFNLEKFDYVLTGVDIDEAGLELRKNTLRDLHETILGDLCVVDLGEEKYDVIYCSNVLEHVERADIAVKNFAKWIKPGGIIVILIPDPHSVPGFVTRVTPHWFHIFYYRFFLHDKNAGKPGYAPFPTHYHPIVSRKGLREYCDDGGNNLELAAEYGGTYIKPGRGATGVFLQFVVRTINILSFGTLSAKHSNLLYVIRKKVD